MPRPLILLHDPAGSPWVPELKHFCALQGIRLRPVEPNETGRTVASLAGDTSAGGPAPAEPIPEPLLVLCHLTDPQLNRLLAALRKEGAGSCLKAVLTPANGGWTLSALYRELCRERLSMGLAHQT